MACSPAFPRRASRRAASSASPGATVLLRPTGPAPEPPAGSGLGGSERVVNRGCLTRGCVRRGCSVSPLGAAAPPGGCGATVSLVSPPPPAGWGGGGGGGGGGVGGLPAVPPRLPGAASRRPRGGGLVVPVPGGQPLTGGGVPFSRLPSALGCRALAQALARVPCSPAVAARCRLAGGRGRAGVCWGRWSGSVVSGSRAAGQ